MEAEVKHYYNYFLIQADIAFDTFIAALSRDLSRSYPGLEFNMAWVRQCDALNCVRSARQSVAKLRRYVREKRILSVSFWDILWKLYEVSFKAHCITYAEAGTSRKEVHDLAWNFLLQEGMIRIKDLRRKLRYPEATAARNSFVIVDNMLCGIPIPKETFCTNRQTHYSSGGPYQTYRQVASGRIIAPEDVNWSYSEHRAAQNLLFSEERSDDDPRPDQFDPSAPATIEKAPVSDTAMSERIPAQQVTLTGEAAMQDVIGSRPWSAMVHLTMRTAPSLPQSAVHPG